MGRSGSEFSSFDLSRPNTTLSAFTTTTASKPASRTPVADLADAFLEPTRRDVFARHFACTRKLRVGPLGGKAGNAVALTEEAGILFNAGRSSRAYALAHLAHEELAKCSALLNIWLLERAGGDAPWELFWHKWRNHDFKVQLALAGDMLRMSVSELPAIGDLSGVEELPAGIFDQMGAVLQNIEAVLPRHTDLVRLRTDATYVDFRDGAVVLPSEVISHEMAAGMVEAAKMNCQFVTQARAVAESALATDHPVVAQLMSIVARSGEGEWPVDLAPDAG